jgi:hypothetical protein
LLYWLIFPDENNNDIHTNLQKSKENNNSDLQTIESLSNNLPYSYTKPVEIKETGLFILIILLTSYLYNYY